MEETRQPEEPWRQRQLFEAARLLPRHQSQAKISWKEGTPAEPNFLHLLSCGHQYTVTLGKETKRPQDGVAVRRKSR